MKKAWDDFKCFVTVAMIGLLYIIVIADIIINKRIGESILLLVTNLITATFTYFFNKKEKKEKEATDDEK